jgi:hypothetical protein
MAIQHIAIVDPKSHIGATSGKEFELNGILEVSTGPVEG